MAATRSTLNGRLDRLSMFCSTSSILCSSFEVLILTASPVAQSYCVSPYSGLQPFFWLLVASGFFLTAVSYLAFLYSESNRRSVMLMATASLLLAVLVIGMMPYIRDAMLMNRVDTLAYLGGIRDVLSGHSIDTVYPAYHLFIASLCFSVGAEPQNIIGPLAPAMATLTVLFSALLAQSLKKSRVLLVATLIASATFPMGYLWSRPYEFAVLLLPFLMSLLILASRGGVEWKVAVFVVATFYVFIHPVILVVSVVCFCFAILFFPKNIPIKDGNLRSPLRLYVISSGIVFLAWTVFIYSRTLVGPLEAFVAAATMATSGDISTYAQNLGISLTQAVLLAARTYASNIVVVLVILVATVVGRRNRRPMNLTILRNGVRLLLFWCLFVSLFLAVTFLNVSVITFDLRRLVSSLGILLPVLLGVAAWQLWELMSLRRVVSLILVLVLPLCFMLATLSIYQSPYVGVQNQQVMRGELSGIEWVMERIEPRQDVFDLGENEYLRSSFPGTVDYGQPYSRYQLLGGDEVTYGGILGPNYTHFFTMSVVREARIYAENLPVGYYVTPEMLERFKEDSSVSRVFSNGDYSVYLVAGGRAT